MKYPDLDAECTALYGRLDLLDLGGNGILGLSMASWSVSSKWERHTDPSEEIQIEGLDGWL